MQLDVDNGCELSDEHPTVCELTEEEAALYSSAFETRADSLKKISEYKRWNDSVNLESPELAEIAEQLQEVSILCDLIEELAVWRLTYLEAPVGDKERPSGRKAIMASSKTVEKKDA